MENEICNCGVPFSLHNTCCGWNNANLILSENETFIPAVISAEEKEIRWLISQSKNADRLMRWFANKNQQYLYTASTVQSNLTE